MKIALSPTGRIRAEHMLVLPVSASVAWGQMRDVEWMLTRDPLHVRVALADDNQPWTDWCTARLIISHRIFGIGPDRIGRVRGWKEGRGYAVSDLSRHGLKRGFPHVCAFRLEPIDDRFCHLYVAARGRWTAQWVPQFLIRKWLWWVLAATGLHIRSAFADHARWLATREA